jgi:hypothetical protein
MPVGLSVLDIETNEIGSLSTGDVKILDPLKVDEINANLGFAIPILFPTLNRKNISLNGVIVPENELNSTSHEFIIGYGAGDSIPPASNFENTFIGPSSGNSLSIGQENTFLGWSACSGMSNGSNNVVLGANAGAFGAQQIGDSILIGRRCADFLDSGVGNIIIGTKDDNYGPNYPISVWGTFNGDNNIMIGKNVRPSNFSGVNNEITLGNSSHTVLRCNVTTITSLSDERDKKEIETLPVGLEFVEKLKPVKFVWNDREDENKRDIVDFGFIAQDLKATQEEENASFLNLVYESNPDKLEASYGKLLPILVKAIQEMSTEIKSLKEEILTLKIK